MASKGSLDPNGIPVRIIVHLSNNRGGQRAFEIAAALGLDTQRVASIANRVAKAGHIQRVTLMKEGKLRGLSVYAIPGDQVRLRR